MSEAIKDKARDWCEKINDNHLDSRDFYPSSISVDAYTAGYKQCEKDMREKASDHCDYWDWYKNYDTSLFCGSLETAARDGYNFGWEAATLSSDKRHAERLNVEARKEIQSLKEIIKELSNALESYDFGKGTIGHDTLKRINEKMREV